MNSPKKISGSDQAAALSPKSEAKRQAPKVKHPYRGYTMKEKWLVSLLLALFAPLAICFFGPFEIYGNNMGEFKFVLWDFWLWCGLIALGIAAAIFGLLMLLRGRAYDVCFGLIFGLSLMFFLQGNYLSLGAGALEGDGVGETLSTTKIVVNLVIWILVVAGCVVAMLLLNRFRDTVRLAATVGVIALVGMTVISFAVVSLSTDVYDTEKTGYQGDVTVDNELLTFKNLDTLATDNNIIIFIVDRFDHTYYDKAMKDCPEIFDDLDGFTHFDDYVTLYPRTYPGVPHILTGVEVDFSISRLEYMQNAFSSSPYWQALKEEGFDINVYTDDYYGYDNATYMRDFVSNTSGNIGYDVVSQASLSLDMLRVSLYRYLPFILRPSLGEVSTPMFDQYIVYDTEDPVYSTDMKGVYEAVTDDEFTFRKSKRGVSYIHIMGCHTPNYYGPDFGAVTPEERNDTNVAMKQSFKIISAYINEMKRLGVYDEATILILGDHCSIGADTVPPFKPHVTTLLAKPAGVSRGELKESKAQVSASDIFATVLTAAGSDKAEDFGENIFDVPEDENRIRYYQFQMVEGTFEEGNYLNAELEIVGPGNDYDNWKLIRIVDLQTNIYNGN